MFSKLLKYDFKSVKRFGVPMLLALLGAAVLGAGGIVGIITTIRNMPNDPTNVASNLLASSFMLLIFFVFMVIGAAVVGMQIAILVDYYKSLVTDEGYLTFTLPVHPWRLLCSKLVNSTVWNLIAAAAAFAAGGIILIAGLTAGGLLDDTIQGIMRVMREIHISFDAAISMLLTALLGIAYFFNMQLLYFMAIFFGSVIVKKNKLLAVIGCVLGANFIYGTVSNIFYTIAFMPLLAASDANRQLASNISLSISIVLLTGLSILFFQLTKYMMEKHLNLA